MLVETGAGDPDAYTISDVESLRRAGARRKSSFLRSTSSVRHARRPQDHRVSSPCGFQRVRPGSAGVNPVDQHVLLRGDALGEVGLDGGVEPGIVLLGALPDLHDSHPVLRLVGVVVTKPGVVLSSSMTTPGTSSYLLRDIPGTVVLVRMAMADSLRLAADTAGGPRGHCQGGDHTSASPTPTVQCEGRCDTPWRSSRAPLPVPDYGLQIFIP